MILLEDILQEDAGSFDCDLVGEIDYSCSFCWDCSQYISEEGKQHFAKIMKLPIRFLENGNIFIDTTSQYDFELDEMVEDFLQCVAGFCTEDEYNRWFFERK